MLRYCFYLIKLINFNKTNSNSMRIIMLITHDMRVRNNCIEFHFFQFHTNLISFMSFKAPLLFELY